MVTGDGIVKYHVLTHEKDDIEDKDFVTALINFMGNPVPNEDYTDGFTLVGDKGDKDSIEWVNVEGIHRHVAYYNISCARLPLSCTSFLLYDALQGTFAIHDVLTNNVCTVKDPAKECKQVVNLLCSGVSKTKIPEKELTPVRDLNMFLKNDSCIKHLYSSLSNLSVEETKSWIKKRHCNSNWTIRQLKKKKTKTKKDWSKKSLEFLESRKQMYEQKRALCILFRIRKRQSTRV